MKSEDLLFHPDIRRNLELLIQFYAVRLGEDTGDTSPSLQESRARFFKLGLFDAVERRLMELSAVFRWCESPIEEALICGVLNGLSTLGNVKVVKGDESIVFGDLEGDIEPSLIVEPQSQAGRYRVDFKFSYPYERPEGPPSFDLYVECDGHDYHERTKEQAARDRKRDRWMLDKGLNVMRFTGSEIWRDPIACGDEIRNALAGMHVRRDRELGLL